MRLFKQRNRDPVLGFYIGGGAELPSGYLRLIDSPEVSTCVNRISSIISSATIGLYRKTKNGAERVENGLARFVDVTPWPDMATRQSWMSWIVGTMLSAGDGNAAVLPTSSGGRLSSLVPMPGCSFTDAADVSCYKVLWHGREFAPDEILHFRLFPDLDRPWKGRGIKVQADRLAASLRQTGALKDSLSSPDYKPPLIVSVDADVEDLSDEEKREKYRKLYLEDTNKGKPWILPAGLMKVEQVKPLSLTDLAIRETVELDKRTVASLFGVPPFLLGIGSYNKDEYNNFIASVVVPICKGIEQELTLKLLMSDEMYFKFNRRHLYCYDLTALVNLDLAMSDRGFMTGDEVREDAFRNPAGLSEFRALENYIPWDMAALQSKLN